jgi:DNA-3-methyladenine glycosylase II
MKNLTDEEVIEQLTKVKGIGRWTAEMFLIFSLCRQDVLPVGDLGLKKGIQRLYSLSELPEKEEMEKIAQKWRPYRSVATWYLWRSLNQFDIG